MEDKQRLPLNTTQVTFFLHHCRDFATDVSRAELLTVFVNSLTWTGPAAGSSSSGIRRASPAVAAAAASHLAGVILFALQPRGSLYVYVLASKGCKWL